MPRIAIVLVVVGSVLLPSASTAQVGDKPIGSAQEAVRVAFFSPQRAYQESSAGKVAQAKLDAFRQEKTREIDAQNRRLAEQVAAYKQSESILSDEVRRTREQSIAKFELDLKRLTEDAQAQFLGVQRDVESTFLARMQPAVREVAKSKGLLLVFNQDAGPFAWADPSLDITRDVVKQLDQP